MPPERAATLLGVDAASSAEDVQRAFLRAARRTHPDTLPSTADEPARRAAAAAFDDLMRARAALLAVAGVSAPAIRETVASPPPRRGIGGSLVVLALLAFLLVALVTLQEAFRSETVPTPAPTVLLP